MLRVASVLAFLAILVPLAGAATVQLQRADAEHRLTVLIDGKKILEYHYAPDHFLSYIHPLLSPSGKDLLVKLTKPYPHHRSFWFTDFVELEGHKAVNFYSEHYRNQSRIRHDKFTAEAADKTGATLKMELLWEQDKKIPVLKETRHMRIVPLDGGQYFLDVRFTVAADYGNVRFASDATHYAWPYLRMHPQFSVAKGGTLVNSEGGVNQKGTHNRVAKWCDYTNTIDGATEGIAFFSHSENEHPHRWLTRDYGCFGPRRVDAKSGNKKFVLKKGETLTMRVGILVHTGNVKDAAIAKRYDQYIKGELSKLE